MQRMPGESTHLSLRSSGRKLEKGGNTLMRQFASLRYLLLEGTVTPLPWQGALPVVGMALLPKLWNKRTQGEEQSAAMTWVVRFKPEESH